MMIASGLVGKDEKFAKLEAFLWRQPPRAVELLRPANLQLVTIRIFFELIKKTQNYMEYKVLPVHPLACIRLRENRGTKKTRK